MIAAHQPYDQHCDQQYDHHNANTTNHANDIVITITVQLVRMIRRLEIRRPGYETHLNDRIPAY